MERHEDLTDKGSDWDEVMRDQAVCSQRGLPTIWAAYTPDGIAKLQTKYIDRIRRGDPRVAKDLEEDPHLHQVLKDELAYNIERMEAKTMDPICFRACEIIDAALFTGDSFWDKTKRKELKEYLDRWAAELETIEELDAEDE